MFAAIARKLFGSKNERDLKKLEPLVRTINELEPSMKSLSDEGMQAKTIEFRERLAKDEEVDDLLPEAFALVREASIRTLGMRHFDVQLIGGIVLHQGKIAEMKTGEGKTLAATLPVYLNGLTEKGVHVVTVNDYLAKRDSDWMGAIYRFLGLSVGVIVHDLSDEERRTAYNCDVTYGTNNEFGFDYLRDNMKFALEDYVQRDLHYAIVDEVDSILIDEARTPLIISGPTHENTDRYYKINRIIPGLQKEQHYTIDEKARSVVLTEDGVARVEKSLNVSNLYDPSQMEILHHVNQALKAHTLFKNDVDYIVKDGQVIIVDEFTGRLMPGRRYSDGLHQALEAKESVKIENENQTLATITFQNYFRMYDKLAGMTGTADTEAAEFKKIYNLEVVVIPTNLPMVRNDNSDLIYKNEQEKFDAVVEEIRDLYERGQPVLVGTISIEKSEYLARRLKKLGIPHNVLNAKNHALEAEIVAQAGRYKALTISTNMAGRGTDIVLGGNPTFLARSRAKKGEDSEEFAHMLAEFKQQCEEEKGKVIDAGGLHILGTERHESRRIDNQLRGRSGRQGDPGSSRFYLSLEDDLMRIFGGDRVKMIMERVGMEEGEPIEHRYTTKAIENAQKKVEAHNFDIRKHLLEFDDVMNKQREVIYSQRRFILGGQDLRETIQDMIEDMAEDLVERFTDPKVHFEEWDMQALTEALWGQFGTRFNFDDLPDQQHTPPAIKDKVVEEALQAYERKTQEISPEIMRQLEKFIMLQSVDNQWKDHLLSMDHLKDGIGLRGYGQRDPLKEYQREGYEMFIDMSQRIKEETVRNLFIVKIATGEELEEIAPQREQEIVMSHGDSASGGDSKPKTVRRQADKVGRNDPCPCGSGKKYKKCCGKAA
ncbi:MAG: preprotein translocase subunit SecA [Desulfomonile tiedjei]|uniref:Protein translocase subunit SecA n=1 Tax=Desulfomonile tiedjei TaxID=2358 RepID=A0A9D6V7Q1_9BACT|nr:preprotein translocase subunit SecA [Desulfomonile tiedjei]